jgi:hypothetical protein
MSSESENFRKREQEKRIKEFLESLVGPSLDSDSILSMFLARREVRTFSNPDQVAGHPVFGTDGGIIPSDIYEIWEEIPNLQAEGLIEVIPLQGSPLGILNVIITEKGAEYIGKKLAPDSESFKQWLGK